MDSLDIKKQLKILKFSLSKSMQKVKRKFSKTCLKRRKIRCFEVVFFVHILCKSTDYLHFPLKANWSLDILHLATPIQQNGG